MSGAEVQVALMSPRDAVHLLEAHHALMQFLFSEESNNYLELEELQRPEIRFFGASLEGDVIGCGALAIKPGYGEIKSMHVAETARGKGVAGDILGRLISEAKREKLKLLAHRLYARHGFSFRGPFGDYPDLPESMFMEKRLY